ncbi:MAG: PAS domain-containing protein, partial [Planctomycetota bacterium]
MTPPTSTGRRSDAAEESRRGEEGYRALVGAILETAVEGILTIDEQGTIESINPAAERIFGYAADEVIGRSVNVLMPSPYREEHDHYVAEYLATRRKKIIGTGRQVVGLRKDGTTFPMDIAVSEVGMGDRTIFTGFVRDITELKRAQEELQRERDFAESLIEKAQAIVLVLDPAGRIVRFNPYMEQLCGYRLDEVRAQDWFSTFLPERHASRIHDVFHRTLERIDTTGAVSPIRTRDGGEREIRWSNKTLKDAQGKVTGVLAIGHDV